jgi:hypothetical protein
MRKTFVGAVALLFVLGACELPLATQLNSPLDVNSSNYDETGRFTVSALSLNGGGPSAGYTGVHAVLANTSVIAATNVDFALVVSDTAAYSASARKIYEGKTSLPAQSNQALDVTLAQIQSYLAGPGAATAPVDGNYYWGAVVNASSVSPTALMAPSQQWFVNGTFPQVVLQGKFVTTGQIVVNSASGYIALANGSYPLVVGAVPSNSPLITGTVAGSFPLNEIFAPGWKLYSGTLGNVTYNSSTPNTGTFNGGIPPSYLLGIPYPGNWLVVGALLVTPGGTFDILTSGGPVEPVGLLAAENNPSGPPFAVSLTSSLTGQDLTVMVQSLVSVGPQQGTFTGGNGNASFQIAKINVGAGTGGINWYTDVAGTVGTGPPANSSSNLSENGSGAATYSIYRNTSPYIPTGIYYFRVSYPNANQSNVVTLTVQ